MQSPFADQDATVLEAAAELLDRALRRIQQGPVVSLQQAIHEEQLSENRVRDEVVAVAGEAMTYAGLDPREPPDRIIDPPQLATMVGEARRLLMSSADQRRS